MYSFGFTCSRMFRVRPPTEGLKSLQFQKYRTLRADSGMLSCSVKESMNAPGWASG
ncbi:hypothetical protein D3C81_2167800 [compost metagenome]